ncbi:sarcosine oxidase subunit alpha [Sphingomonas zeicaulis]|uniref:(2Fe-2S)-binding protein n=1 Tax=Sphingomonas zeicaulis TaxID=1632740 RepID=UPI003D2316E7
MRRIENDVTRPQAVTVEVDGQRIAAHPGEMIAVAVFAVSPRFRADRSGRARGMFCNMGTCSECTVWVDRQDIGWRRLRSCLVPVADGLRIRTDDPDRTA